MNRQCKNCGSMWRLMNIDGIVLCVACEMDYALKKFGLITEPKLGKVMTHLERGTP